MGKNKDAARKEYKNNKQKKMTRHIDGRRFHLTGMGVASGLILEESEFEEELPPSPPPAPRATTFASLMNEAKTGSRDNIPTQPTNEEEETLAAEEDAAQPACARRKVQVLTQPVTYGLPIEDDEEFKHREEGIEGARTQCSTAVSLCNKNHICLICHWSFSDPVNRKGAWRLQLADYRRNTLIFENGFEEHKQCVCKKRPELLDTLGRRMIQTFEEREDTLWNIRGKEKKDEDWRNGVEKEKSPALWQIVRELGPLTVYVMGTGYANNTGEKGEEDGSCKKGDAGDDGKNHENDKGKAVKTRRELQKVAELSSLRRRMEEQAQRKAADQKRVERQAKDRAEKQRMANGADAIGSLVRKNVGSDRRGQMPEDHGKASRLKSKMELAIAHLHEHKCDRELEERRKQPKPKKVVKAELTEEEQDALHSIQAAQQEEADQLDQAEKEDEERLLQLAAEQEQAGGQVEQEEEEEDDGLTDAILDAFNNASPEPEPTKNDSAKDKQKRTSSSMLSTTESAPDASDDRRASTPPAKERKRRPKQRARPIVEDSSEDSDSVKAPKPSKRPKPKPKAHPKTPKPTVPFAEFLIARASRKAGKNTDTEEGKERTEKSEKTDTNPKTSKLATQKTRIVKPKNGKVYKSEEFIAASDLEDSTTDGVDLPTDNLYNENVSVEITGTDTTTVSIEQDGNVVEEVVETTTVAVEVKQEDGSTERTEVTETTIVCSNSSERGEVTVDHATHVQAVTVPDVPEQGFPRNSPPPSSEREWQEDSTPTDASGMDDSVTSPEVPPASPSLPRYHSDSSSKKRKRKETSEEAQPEPETEPDTQDAPSQPKRCKITPPSSSVVKEVVASGISSVPPASEKDTPSPQPGPAAHDPRVSRPTSPGANSVTSSASSSSSKKRKLTWSEEDGEVTISPGGMKRVKRVQSRGEVVDEASTQETKVMERVEAEGASEEGKTKDSVESKMEGRAGAQDAESAEVEGEESDDFESLFGSPTNDKGKI